MLDEDASGVQVTFASGTQRWFDLVVGADGVHSRVRRLVATSVLAGELAVADGDHLRASPAYQARMQAYVEQRMELPPGGIRMALPMTSVGIRMRDTSTRVLTSRLFAGLLTTMAATKPDAIELPDYSIQRGDPVRIPAEQAE